MSNGHGEDDHSSHVVRTLRELDPSIDVAALPIVGEGHAYRRLGVPIAGPTLALPSGGFTYMNRWLLVQDIRAGLPGLTWRQLRALRRQARTCDLVHATGDLVAQGFAWLSGRPYVSFISCLSALYEGRLRVDALLARALRSRRCRAVFTRDQATADDLQRQGFSNVRFGGIPSLDRLLPAGRDLRLRPDAPMIALLPGSRLPEAARNFRVLLRLVREIARLAGPAEVQFRAALVPDLMAQAAALAAADGWQADGPEHLRFSAAADDSRRGTDVPPPRAQAAAPGPAAEVRCYADAFGDILHGATLMLGMAGLAVDQGVALGKPVIQIPGDGPQFTYRFAEAQNRLLGISAQTIGTGPATPETLRLAAERTIATLGDREYLARAGDEGRRRLGAPGASRRIAEAVLALTSR